MRLIGQTLNSSDAHVRTAMASGDVAWLRDLALRQMERGMSTLDVNAGALGEDEGEILRWLIPWLENIAGVGLCIDSADPGLLFDLEPTCRLRPILNSLTLDDRWPDWLADATLRGTRIIVQMRGRGGLPSDRDDRLRFAELCLERLQRHGVAVDAVYLDPVLLPWGADLRAGRGLLEFLEVFDEIPTLVGLSNSSYGHEGRAAIHRLWFSELCDRGLSAAIVDPFDPAWRRVEG